MTHQRMLYAALFAALATVEPLAAATFQYLPCGIAKAVSDDGKSAVGTRTSEAILCRDGLGTRLGDLPGGALSSSGWGISGNGQVVVGMGTIATGPQAFVWRDGVLSPLPFLPGGTGEYIDSIAYDATYDGSTIVGNSTCLNTRQPVKWVNGEVRALPCLAGLSNGSATAISSNGRYIVGKNDWWTGSEWLNRAVIWRDGTIAYLGDLSGGLVDGIAMAVSEDGSVVVGRSASGNSYQEAFRWKNGVMTGLGFLPGGTTSVALGVSGDGSIVIGTCTTSEGQQAFIWDAQHGMRNLADALAADFGLSVDRSKLNLADDISPDGRFIVGGGSQGWMITVPEPSTLLLMCGVLTPALRRRSRRSQVALPR